MLDHWPSWGLTLSPGCQCLIPDVLDLDICPPEDSASPLVSLSLVCLFLFSYLCECPLPGLHGGEEVLWLRSYLFGDLKLLDVLSAPYPSYMLTIYL